MSTIVTRAGKGSPLTNAEVDSNFTNLNTDKVEAITSADGSVVVSSSGTTRDLSVGVAGSTATLISQVRNQTGATLAKGTVVYISGASGNKAVVSKAIATGDSTSAQTYGMVQADIPNNQNGYVVVIGAVSGLDTSAFTDGTQLYLSGTTAGTYTNTKPYAPTHLVYVGVVTYSHATQGTIQVKIQNGYELDEIHDVAISSPATGQILVYNAVTGLWSNSSVLSSYLPITGGTMTGNVNFLSNFFTLQDDTDATKQARFVLSGLTTGTTYSYTLPALANATLATTGTLTQTFSGTTTFTGGVSFTAATSGYNIGTSASSGAVTIGGTAGTGILTFGRSTVSQTTNIQAGVTASGSTKTLNIGTGGAAGSTTTITIGSATGTSTVNIQGTLQDDGNAVLSAANYNSYSPTLTGTGASGTWGISISGNAATVTSVTSSQVTTALGFTPYNSTNPSGYISGITSGMVTTALGYTPYNATNPSGYTSNTGTVTSVNVSVPTGLSVTGSPITTSGTVAISLTAGYSIPTTASQTTWDTASTERRQWDGGATNLVAATGRTSLGLVIGTNVQAWDADIDAIAALAGTSGFLKKTAANTWSLDTSTYLTGITSTQVTTALGYTPYNATNPSGYITSTASITGNAATATVLQTARLINGVSFNGSADITVADGTKLPLAGGTMSGAIAFAAGQTWPTFNQSTTGSAATLTTGRTIAITGDVTYTSGSFDGSANVTGAATLASVGTAGTYTKVTTDAKGRITSGSTLAAADIPSLDASKITSGTIDAARLPSYVDDVVEAANLAAFPVTGETGKIYVALDTNKTYRWSGSAYVYITSGAVDSVAGKTGVVTLVKADVGLGSVDNTADSAKSVASAATLVTGRTIALTGDVAYTSGSFNGSANVTGVATLANSGVTAGTYTKVTVDAKGRVTVGASLASADLPTYTGTITSSQITTGLGFTPYNATNPSGYITASASITGTAAGLTDNSNWMLGRGSVAAASVDTATSNGFYTQNNAGDSQGLLVFNAAGSLGPLQMTFTYGGLFQFRNKTDSTTWNAWRTVLTSLNYNSYSPTLTGGGASGSWGINVTGSAGSVAWTGVTGRPTAVSSFTNDSGYITSSSLSSYLPLSGGTVSGRTTFADGLRIGPTPGDPYAYIITRTMPAGDPNVGNEATELLLFHSNDNANGAGPDYITLRAPAIRFQTYDNAAVADPDASGGWNNRVTISPAGVVNVLGTLQQGGNQVLHASNVSSYAWERTGSWKPASLSGQTRQVGITSPDGGEFGLAYSGGQTYAYVDGWFYQNEGQYRVLDTQNYSSYALPLSGGTISGAVRINNQLQVGQNTNGTAVIDAFGGIARFGRDSTSYGLLLDGNNYATFQNANGYINVGPRNTSWCHFDTDRPRFYFGSSISVNGDIQRYSDSATYIHTSNYNSYSPTLTGGNASGTWGINITGNASTVGSKASSAFQQRIHYGTSAGQSSGYYKIRILPATSWMMSFTIRIYQGYQSFDIRVSGYNYGPYYWYSPEASLLDSSATAIDVRFGYDSAYNLWVAVPAGNYTGLDILDVVNGYSQIDGNYADQFAIEYQASLTGSVQTAVTAYRPVKMNEGLTTSNYTSYVVPISGGTFTGSITSNGNVTAYSDERKKTNWRDYTTDFVEQLAKVKNGTYDRTDMTLTQDGVSAQSLRHVMPNSVSTDADGMLSVNYGAAALASVVELAKRVVDQEKRIAHLESLINKLIGD